MTRDEIIKMAREAGFGPSVAWKECTPPFERFAALVAAAERDALRAEVERLRIERDALRSLDDSLLTEFNKLRAECDALRAEVIDLKNAGEQALQFALQRIPHECEGLDYAAAYCPACQLLELAALKEAK